MGWGADATAGALFSACVFLLVLSVSFWVGARLRPSWGLSWFGAAMALTTVRALVSGLPPGFQAWWPHVAALLAALTLALLHVGLRAYTNRPIRRPAYGVAVAVAAWFLVRGALQLAGVGGMAGPFASGVLFLYLSTMCWRGLKGHAGRAYALAASVLVFHPVFVLGLGVGVAGADLAQLRGWAAVGTAVVGLGLLMAAMGRMRMELEHEVAMRAVAEEALKEVNAQLEVRVKDRTAELEELVGDLESFNRMVSHDLRGPLGGVQGVAALCIQKLDAGEIDRVRHYLQLIQGESDRLVRLVGQLLTLAKVTHVALDCREIALNDVLDRALAVLQLSHGAEKVACVHASALPAAKVDPLLLEQVFVNLVGNAIKFAGQMAKPEVRVKSDAANTQIVVEVRDNGPGFEPEKATTLFQPFTRLHGKEIEGHGIGLSIVRRIIERHGGKVWAEGRPGDGASFYFSLPG